MARVEKNIYKNQTKTFYSNLKSIKDYNKKSLKERFLLKTFMYYTEPVDTDYVFKHKIHCKSAVEPYSIFKSGRVHYLYSNDKLLFTLKNVIGDETKNMNIFHIFNSNKKEIGLCCKEIIIDNPDVADTNLYNYGYDKVNNIDYDSSVPEHIINGIPMPANIMNIYTNDDCYNIVYTLELSKKMTFLPAMVYKNNKEYFKLVSTSKKIFQSDQPVILHNDDFIIDEAIFIITMLFLEFNM